MFVPANGVGLLEVTVHAGGSVGMGCQFTVSDACGLLRDTGLRWWNHRVPRLSAALAFYTMLSLAPLLTLLAAFAGLVFGEEVVRGRLGDEVCGLVGPEGGAVVQILLAAAPAAACAFASVSGLLVLLAQLSFWLAFYELHGNVPLNLLVLLGILAVIGGFYVISGLVFPLHPERWPDFDDHYFRVRRTVTADQLDLLKG